MKMKIKKPYVSGDVFFKQAMKDKELKILYDEEIVKMEIAKAVRNARAHAKLTQAGLAKKMNISQSLIARLESGQDERTPTLPLLGRILAQCGASLELGIKFKNAS
jgi:ribosome-binding protein aMBF1 (putative translation factor)